MIAEIRLWDRVIGAVALDRDRGVAAFQYSTDFARSGIEVAPLMMPLSTKVYEFPGLPTGTFHGLPGLLADSLPDKFGNALIDAWLASEGRTPESFDAVERLCYTGRRGMGALEFTPAIGPKPRKATKIEIESLVRLASDVLTDRTALKGSFRGAAREKALNDILRVGTSAGGARAKAVVAWNPESNEVRSGQVDAGKGFGYWLLKFDGVGGNRDKELNDPKGYGAVEYAYYLMARKAGISMNECRLLEENGRRHFMTKRFDRLEDGGKIHMQSLCALAHYDFNMAGGYSYEQAIQAIRKLGLGMDSVEEQFRRMVFNIVARNQDDHVKNIAFLMDRSGRWSLAPAFDVTYSYNPDGAWTSTHQMSLAGKRDGFTRDDLKTMGRTAMMKNGRAKTILAEVTEAVAKWLDFADAAEVDPKWRKQIEATHRTRIV